MRVVAVAGVAAFRSERDLLLVHRQDGSWAHPAGRVEPGETWEQAAVREFAEETGGVVRLDGLLGIYSDPATQAHRYPSGESVQFVGVAFRGTVDSLGEPESGEIRGFEWIAEEHLPSSVFGPARPVVEDAFRWLRGDPMGRTM